MKGNGRPVIVFFNKERKLHEFKEACHYVQTSPKSHFTQRRFITIATENGRRTLIKNTLTITENNKKHKEEIEEKNIDSLLEDYFGIYVTEEF